MAMSKEQLRAILQKRELRQADLAWICGCGLRQARSWCLGEYPIPQAAELLVRAFDGGLITEKWLAKWIDRPVP
jgi:hypothetical protein